MGVSVTINGAENAIGILDELQEGINEGITRGVSEAGEIVVTEAKANCPVDTGNLRSSINKQASGNTCTVGTNCEYAGYVEFGTYKMAAQPYLVPALLNNVDAIVSAVTDAIKS